MKRIPRCLDRVSKNVLYFCKMELEHIMKNYNKILLLYYIVCPSKYRREVFSKKVETTLKETCKGINDRYEINFVEIGSEEDHDHFLVQSVPMYSVKKIVQIIKSITAIEIFKKHPEVRKKLWGWKFWTSGYYDNTVGKYGNVEVIRKYVMNQGGDYTKIHTRQLSL